MLDVYEKGEYTQAQADAVAQLMLHCGVAGTEVKGPNGNTIFLPSHSFPDVPFWFTR